MMNHEQYMKHALREAQRAADANEVPVGAVIVMQNRIIARGYNQVEMLSDSTAHAEIIALTSAFNYLGSKYLPDATIYVTIEPCTMCCGALYWSKIGTVVYGADDPKHGGFSIMTAAASQKKYSPLHPKTHVISGVCSLECSSLMKGFFRSKR